MKMLVMNLILLCTAMLAQQGARKEAPGEQRVGLIQLEATNRIVEGPIREGNFDYSFQIKRARYFVPDLLDCSNRIATVTTQWANAQGATVERAETGAHRVLLHLARPNIPGHYELLYRVDLSKGTASVEFSHLHRGVLTSPDQEPGVDKLVPVLKEALTCVQSSSSSSH